MEAAVQRIRVTSSPEIPRNAPSRLVADEMRRAGADGPPVGKRGEDLRRTIDRVTRCRTCSQEDQCGIFSTRKRLSVSEQDRCVRRLEARTPQTWHCSEKKDDESARLKEYFSWWESGQRGSTLGCRMGGARAQSVQEVWR